MGNDNLTLSKTKWSYKMLEVICLVEITIFFLISLAYLPLMGPPVAKSEIRCGDIVKVTVPTCMWPLTERVRYSREGLFVRHSGVDEDWGGYKFGFHHLINNEKVVVLGHKRSFLQRIFRNTYF